MKRTSSGPRPGLVPRADAAERPVHAAVGQPHRHADVGVELAARVEVADRRLGLGVGDGVRDLAAQHPHAVGLLDRKHRSLVAVDDVGVAHHRVDRLSPRVDRGDVRRVHAQALLRRRERLLDAPRSPGPPRASPAAARTRTARVRSSLRPCRADTRSGAANSQAWDERYRGSELAWTSEPNRRRRGNSPAIADAAPGESRIISHSSSPAMKRSSRWRRRLAGFLLVVLALVAVAGVSALVIRFAPPWLVSTKGLTGAARLDELNRVRVALRADGASRRSPPAVAIYAFTTSSRDRRREHTERQLSRAVHARDRPARASGARRAPRRHLLARAARAGVAPRTTARSSRSSPRSSASTRPGPSRRDGAARKRRRPRPRVGAGGTATIARAPRPTSRPRSRSSAGARSPTTATRRSGSPHTALVGRDADRGALRGRAAQRRESRGRRSVQGQPAGGGPRGSQSSGAPACCSRT